MGPSLSVASTDNARGLVTLRRRAIAGHLPAPVRIFEYEYKTTRRPRQVISRNRAILERPHPAAGRVAGARGPDGDRPCPGHRQGGRSPYGPSGMPVRRVVPDVLYFLVIKLRNSRGEV